MKILGIQYQIKFIDDNCRADNCMGRSDTKTCEINISESMPEDNKRMTLLHETIHVLDEILLLKMTEEQVTALSSALFSVFKDNKDFLKNNVCTN